MKGGLHGNGISCGSLALILAVSSLFCAALYQSPAFAGIPYAVTKSLGLGHAGPSDGRPDGALIAGPDGALYGTASGTNTMGGSVFKLNLDGSNFQTLHLFGLVKDDGTLPLGGLTLGPDGFLYGTTSGGGTAGMGTVFRLYPDGSEYKVIHNVVVVSGSSPRGGLVMGNDGAFYGITSSAVFRIRPDGSGYSVIQQFSGNRGSSIRRGLLKASDGNLYGACSEGGLLNGGTIFRMTPDGSSVTFIHHFDPVPDGRGPRTRLIEGNFGLL